jgi:molecular chaperone GrpE (heat shock protein)
MQDTTLTIDNLQRIYVAMQAIAPIDRSNYFNSYLHEVRQRIEDHQHAEAHIKEVQKAPQVNALEIP